MPTTRSDSAPPLSVAYVEEIFRNLQSGDGKKFFDHVAEDVDWIVGTLSEQVGFPRPYF